MVKFKTVEERETERQKILDEIETRRANRKIKRKIDDEVSKRSRFELKSIGGTIIIAASLTSALIGSRMKPTDVGFVGGSNITTMEKTQDDLDDYESKRYYIESVDGRRYIVPFSVLDEAVPRVEETQTFVNFSEGDSVPVGITRVERYPDTKILVFLASAIGILSGGALSFKAGEQIGKANNEIERLRGQIR